MAAVQETVATVPIRTRQKRSAEVIVVGASLSGLQAAHEVQRSGSSCLVLEARSRVGARPAYDVSPSVDAFDESKHARVVQLARQLGLAVGPQRPSDRLAMEGLGGSEAGGIPDHLAEEDCRSFVRVRDNVEHLCQRVDVNRPAQLLSNYGSMTMHELAVSQGGTAAVQKLVSAWATALFALPSDSVSALYFLVHCKSNGGLLETLSLLGGSQGNLQLPGGSRRLCEELADRLQPGSVLLSQEVEAVDQRAGNKCVLTTRSGDEFHCTTVILGSPASQCRSLDFAPGLSEDKQWLRGHRAPAPVDALEPERDEEVACLAVPAINLHNLQRDQWRPEGSIVFAGSETSFAWRGTAEGALAAGCRAAGEAVRALGDRPSSVPVSRL
ncbi:hypothetical protein CDD83_3724 [Cordyceps sp. RAO-2017]|nr:hypothetical protein CDD83_3724 [Cordyceps sp. RAO-2017]